jgi:transposase
MQDADNTPKAMMPQEKNMKPKATRWKISDELWNRIEPLLPVPVNTHPRGGGKKRVAYRTVMNGILFVLKTGCQWKALDATGICSGSTAHARFQEWERAGVFLQFWKNGLQEYDDLRGLDWKWQTMDGSMTKAPLGGGKNRQESD